MKTGWQEYKDDWYYLNPDNGVMRVDCTIDGYRLDRSGTVSYTHLRAHETKANLVCRLLLEKKKN